MGGLSSTTRGTMGRRRHVDGAECGEKSLWTEAGDSGSEGCCGGWAMGLAEEGVGRCEVCCCGWIEGCDEERSHSAAAGGTVGR